MTSSIRWLRWPALLLALVIPGMLLFMVVTAPVFYPDPGKAPSVADGDLAPQYLDPVTEARKIVRAHLSAENLPGISVAVGIGDQLVWSEGFGYADLRTHARLTPRHKLRIGTASQLITSAAAGVLLDEGRWNFDDEIQTYVPEFPRKPWPVTVRQLLGNTAGIIPDGGDESPLLRRHCKKPVEGLADFAKNDLMFEPGTQYMQSDFAWVIVSASIEAATGKPFHTFVRERVLEPAGMRATMPDPGPTGPDDDHPLENLLQDLIFDPYAVRETAPETKPQPAPDRATSYFPRLAADPTYGLHGMGQMDLSCYSGAAVFLSTPSDLVRFGMAMQNGRILRPKTVQLLQSSERLASGEETGHGLGWDLGEVSVGRQRLRTASGDGRIVGGMASSLITLPDHGMTVAVIANISYAETAPLARKIVEAFAKPVSRGAE
ncbi:MAG: serine hydrolase domain-containing protein [Bryobacteraceae bacterium]